MGCLAEEYGFGEELGPAGKGNDQHVHDPFLDQRKLDAQRGLNWTCAVQFGGFEHVPWNVGESPVDYEDPGTGTSPECDQRKDDWEVARYQ